MAEGNGSAPAADRTRLLRALVANQIVANQMWMWERLRSMRGLGDPRRSVEDDCGHNFENWSAREYQTLYDASELAAKIVHAWPDECAVATPAVYESERGQVTTPFEVGWKDHAQPLVAGGEVPFEEEEGNPVLSYLHQADRLCGVGRYGVMLHGVDDGLDLSEPAVTRPDARLLYLRVFTEAYAAVEEVDNDPESPRFRQPLSYSLALDGDRTELVHWTRVTHVSEGDVYHEPRLQRLRAREQDVRKVLGGSAEGYWRSGVPVYALEAPPQLAQVMETLDASDVQNLKDTFERMMNGSDHSIVLQWLTAKSLAPAVVDPGPFLERQLEMVAIAMDLPKRVFMGSERGQLASSQDQKAHNKRVLRRCNRVVTPRVILPYIGTSIRLGVLPMPQQVRVWWPPLDQLGEQEAADKSLKLSQALASYASAGGPDLMPLLDYLTRVWGWDEDEAAGVAEAYEKARAERERKEAEAMAQQQQQQAQAPRPGPNPNATPQE